MAAPAQPQSFYVQQGNGQVYLSWGPVAGATSYDVQRSTNNVTFASIATPTNAEYLDTSVLIGVQYYYKVASINGDGTGIYTSAQGIVPTITGTMSLGQVRLLSQQRADRVNSNFVTLPEWNTYINQSYFELYDLLTTLFEDYYLAEPITFTTNGTEQKYALPNGENYSGARPFYKLRGVDIGIQNNQNAYVTVNKFNFIDRNKYVYPNSASTMYGVFNLQYRVMGDYIYFIPTPSGNQPMRLWYIPRLVQLLKDTDIMDGVSGWSEYVVIDAAIKALQKEESDVSVLFAEKQQMIARINGSAANRDAGSPDRVSDVRSQMWGNGWGSINGGFGPIGGW